jgi:hypothetical protein
MWLDNPDLHKRLKTMGDVLFENENCPMVPNHGVKANDQTEF